MNLRSNIDKILLPHLEFRFRNKSITTSTSTSGSIISIMADMAGEGCLYHSKYQITMQMIGRLKQRPLGNWRVNWRGDFKVWLSLYGFQEFQTISGKEWAGQGTHECWSSCFLTEISLFQTTRYWTFTKISLKKFARKCLSMRQNAAEAIEFKSYDNESWHSSEPFILIIDPLKMWGFYNKRSRLMSILLGKPVCP